MTFKLIDHGPLSSLSNDSSLTLIIRSCVSGLEAASRRLERGAMVCRIKDCVRDSVSNGELKLNT